VTGASGFVGRALVKTAVEMGWDVRAVARKIPPGVSGWTQIENLAVEDKSNESLWDTVFGARNGFAPVVVHLAARAHVLDESAKDPLTLFRQANVDVAVAVAKAAFARGVKRLVFVSSIGAVGDRSELNHPLSERSPCMPRSLYGMSKLEAEAALTELASIYGGELVIVRPPLVYGRGAPGNLAKMSAWIGRGIPLPLAGVRNQRSLIHVHNLCSALLCCAAHEGAPGKIYHVRDPRDYSIPEILRSTAQALGGKARLFPVPSRILSVVAKMLGQSRAFDRLCESLQVDDTLIRRELGVAPKSYPFEL
jgi:UDP-glucose 4-epimerase